MTEILEQKSTVEYRGDLLLCLAYQFFLLSFVAFKFILTHISLLFGLQNLHPASIICRGFSTQEARMIRCGAVPLSSMHRCRYGTGSRKFSGPHHLDVGSEMEASPTG
jgi:hypothetical protein